LLFIVIIYWPQKYCTWGREGPQGPPHFVGHHRAKVLRRAFLYPIHYWLPSATPMGDSGPLTHTSRENGKDGLVAVLFNCNWKRDHVWLYILPREGMDARVTLMDWPPPLSPITLSSLLWRG
jgi:hypothetical protein